MIESIAPEASIMESIAPVEILMESIQPSATIMESSAAAAGDKCPTPISSDDEESMDTSDEIELHTRRMKKRYREVIKELKEDAQERWKPRDWRRYKLFTTKFNPADYPSNIEVVHKPSIQEFRENYQKLCKPAVITGVVEHWPAMKKWDIEKLVKKYGNQEFRVSDEKLKLKHFYHYMKKNTDDVPMGIFDHNFADKGRHSQKLLDDYTVPEYFTTNWMKDTPHHPYQRWIVIAPERHGTAIHVDPLGTSAWNAVTHGQKLWAIFPPNTPESKVKMEYYKFPLKKLKDESIRWFRYMYPLVTSESWPKKYKPIIHVQNPGELIFVPAGWWHIVLNITDTVAVTQNFVDESNFLYALSVCRAQRKRFARKWIQHLRDNVPEAVEKFPDVFEDFTTDSADSDTSSTDLSSEYSTDTSSASTSNVSSFCADD